MATRADLISDLRALDLGEATAKHWTDATAAIALNRAQRKIAREAVTLIDEWTTSSVANQMDYILPSAWIPPMTKVLWDWGGTEIELVKTTVRNLAAWVAMGSGTPLAYTMSGDENGLVLRLFPAPSAAGTSNILIVGRRLPVVLSADATVCELPLDTHDAMLEYAAFLMWREWEELERASFHKNTFDELFADIQHRYAFPMGAVYLNDTEHGLHAHSGFAGLLPSETV